MANVPYDGGIASVAPETRAPDNYQRVDANVGAFGGRAAAALGNVGEQASKLGEFWGSVQVDGALNDTMSSLNDTWEGYKTSYRGADALANREKLDKDLDAIVKKGQNGLNQAQMLKFNNSVRSFRERYIGGQVSSYLTSQAQMYATGVNEATVTQAYTLIPNVAGKPDEVRGLIEDAKHGAAKQVDLKYGEAADPKIKAAAVADAEGRGYKTWIDTLAKTGDVNAAIKASEEYKTQLGGYYPQVAAELKAQREVFTGQDVAKDNIAKQERGELRPDSPAPGARPMAGQVADRAAVTGDAGQRIYQGFQQRGFNTAQAAALAGNIKQESSFRTNAYNEAEGATGLIQWRLDRRVALNQFAKDTGRSPLDPNTQMDFVVHEMQGSESKNARAFLNAKTVEEANAALRKYIRYGDKSEGARLDFARQFAGGGAVALPAGAGPSAPQGQYAMAAGRTMTMPNATQPPGPVSLFETPMQSLFDAKQIPAPPPTPEEQTSHLLYKQADLYDAMPGNLNLTEQRAYRSFVDNKIAADKLRIEAQSQAIQATQQVVRDDYTKRLLKHENSQTLYEDVENDDRLQPASKLALKKLILDGTGNHDTNDYGPSYWDAFRAVAAPYGTPGKIIDQTQLYEMWADKKITQQGFTSLSQELNAYKKPEGAGIASTKASIIAYAKQKLTFDQEMLFPGLPPMKDPIGAQIFNGQFIPKFNSAFDKWVAAGKDPYEFMAQKNVDKLIEGMRTKADYNNAKLAASGQLPTEAVVPPPDNVDPDGWAKMMQTPKTAKGTPVKSNLLAGKVALLAQNPTPEMIDLFNNSAFGKAGFNAEKILDQLKVPYQKKAGAAPAPAPIPQPAAPDTGGYLMQQLQRDPNAP